MEMNSGMQVLRVLCWKSACLLLPFCGNLWATDATPIRVTSCQLEAHPDIYDHKLVEVHGQVLYSKFDFEIESACKQHSQAGVWLDLGGDVTAPGGYWGIFSGLPKQKGVDVIVRGVSIPLVHDALLDKFVNDVGATRFRQPNGANCGWECLFYEVTATVRGRFFSATQGGFGLESSNNLLVIEKVLSVSSKRNNVPAGGEFQCTSDRWLLTDDERKALSAIPGCSLRDNFQLCSAEFAKHWGDKVNVKDGIDPGPWMTRDMTLSYQFAGGFIQTAQGKYEMKPGGYVIREACHAIVPPRPASDHIFCDLRQKALPDDVNAAAALQKSIEEGRETWRLSDMTQVSWLAYLKFARESNLSADTPLKSLGCEHGTNAETNQPWAQCTWLSRDDMIETIVDVQKPLYLKGSSPNFERVPWIATGVELNECSTQSAKR
jgi:hypothetical protein